MISEKLGTTTVVCNAILAGTLLGISVGGFIDAAQSTETIVTAEATLRQDIISANLTDAQQQVNIIQDFDEQSDGEARHAASYLCMAALCGVGMSLNVAAMNE